MLDTNSLKKFGLTERPGFIVRVDANSTKWNSKLEELVNMKDYYDLIILTGEPKKAKAIAKKLGDSGYAQERIGYSPVRYAQIERLDNIGFVLARFFANSTDDYYNRKLIFESTLASRKKDISYMTMGTIVVEPGYVNRPTKLDIVKYNEIEKMKKYIAKICSMKPDMINVERGLRRPVVPGKTLIQEASKNGYVMVSGYVQERDVKYMMLYANALMIGSELRNIDVDRLPAKIETLSRMIRSRPARPYKDCMISE